MLTILFRSCAGADVAMHPWRVLCHSKALIAQHSRILNCSAAGRFSFGIRDCRCWASSISCTSPNRVVLGIESSCDDTAAAVVNSAGDILGEAIATQEEVHRQWGGIVPSLAMEAHQQAIHDVVDKAMTAAGIKFSELDAVAYTQGPGLSLCLRVGATKARSVAFEHQLPLVPCHHMEAHALVARLGEEVEFPFLCLLVSGGHNLLLIVRGVGDYMQMGTTMDDSIGEAFDKVARLLGLDAMPSGGPALEAFAKNGDPHGVPLTIPMRTKRTCDFSYSGLKTAVLTASEGKDLGNPTPENFQERADMAASFQYAAVEQLAHRLKYATEWARDEVPSINTLVVAGGVAANKMVRSRLDEVAEAAGYRTVYPQPRLCTDNGVMVAWAGVERLAEGLKHTPPTAEEMQDDWIQVRPRWPLTTDRHPCFVPPERKRKTRLPKKKSKIPCESLTDMTRAQRAAQQRDSEE